LAERQRHSLGAAGGWPIGVRPENPGNTRPD
jgi:hypothetical protein